MQKKAQKEYMNICVNNKIIGEDISFWYFEILTDRILDVYVQDEI